MWHSRWLQSAKGTVLTMTCSFGGGSTGLILNYIFYGGHIIHVGKMVTTVLGSLVCPSFHWMMPSFMSQCQVSYGAITFLCSTIETIAIGTVAALIVFFGNIVKITLDICITHSYSIGLMYFDKNHNIDDPCCTFIGICQKCSTLYKEMFDKSSRSLWCLGNAGSGDIRQRGQDIWGHSFMMIFSIPGANLQGFTFNAYNGLLYGDYYLLGVQATWVSPLSILALVDAPTIRGTPEFTGRNP